MNRTKRALLTAFAAVVLITPLLVCREMAHAAPKIEITDRFENSLLDFATIELEVAGGTWTDAVSFPKLVWQKPDQVREIIGDCL
jgi:hypothetical protein